MELTTKNAVITRATLSNDEHGCLSIWLGLDYGDDGCQGFGGYALYRPKSYKRHRLKSIAGHFIWRVMQIAGVTDWSNLVGQNVRVNSDHSKVQAIGHIVKNDWFDPDEDFKAL